MHSYQTQLSLLVSQSNLFSLPVTHFIHPSPPWPCQSSTTTFTRTFFSQVCFACPYHLKTFSLINSFTPFLTLHKSFIFSSFILSIFLPQNILFHLFICTVFLLDFFYFPFHTIISLLYDVTCLLPQPFVNKN